MSHCDRRVFRGDPYIAKDLNRLAQTPEDAAIAQIADGERTICRLDKAPSVQVEL